MRFKDRKEAGKQLALQLIKYRDQNPIVLALPRGGVVVGFEIACALGAAFDVIIARKIGAPGQPELGIGAVAPGDVRILDEYAINLLGISDEQIEFISADEIREMDRRLRAYRGDRPKPDIRDRTVILVDDGIATGVTIRAAIQSICREKPGRLILAVPVSPPDTALALRAEVDEVVCLLTPPEMRAISLWYDNFAQTTDEEVIELLGLAWQEKRNESEIKDLE